MCLLDYLFITWEVVWPIPLFFLGDRNRNLVGWKENHAISGDWSLFGGFEHHCFFFCLTPCIDHTTWRVKEYKQNNDYILFVHGQNKHNRAADRMIRWWFHQHWSNCTLFEKKFLVLISSWLTFSFSISMPIFLYIDL